MNTKEEVKLNWTSKWLPLNHQFVQNQFCNSVIFLYELQHSYVISCSNSVCFFSSLIKRSTITRFYHLDNRISLLHSDNNLCIWQNNFTKAVCISFSQGICEIIGNTFKMVAFIYRRVIIVGQRLVVFCSINYFIELSNHPKLLLKNDCHLLLAINASLIDSLHDWLNQGTFVVKW